MVHLCSAEDHNWSRCGVKLGERVPDDTPIECVVCAALEPFDG
jgi:hypothetical protein